MSDMMSCVLSGYMSDRMPKIERQHICQIECQLAGIIRRCFSDMSQREIKITSSD